MNKTLFWLTRLCDRLRHDRLPVILYVGSVGGYFSDPPFPALEIVFVVSGTFKGFRVGSLKHDLRTNEAVILNQHFGVQSPRSEGADSWAMIIDVTREPLFAALAKTRLFEKFHVSHPDRLVTAFRNVAAWSSRSAPHYWTVMTRATDLSLSVATASRQSLPVHRKAALYELFAILMDEA